MKLTTHLIDVSEDPAFFDPEMPFGTDIADGDDYQVITDTLEIGSGPNITAGGSAVSVSGLINAITAGPSTTTSSVSSTTAVMPFVAVAVTPAITTNSSIYFFPYPHVGGLNPSGVSIQDPHIQRQNPHHPILYPGMPGGDSYHRYQAMLPSTAFPGLQPTGPPPLW